MTKRILIGGGSGFVGRALTAALQKQGHTVDVISRSAKKGALTWTQVHGLVLSSYLVVLATH